MNRYDSNLEIADLQLRLFVEYSRSLLYDKQAADDATKKLRDIRINSSSVIPVYKKRIPDQVNYTEHLLYLMEIESGCVDRYNHRESFMNYIATRLVDLERKELDLLYLHYERKYSFRKMGQILHYSHMQIARQIDEILRKIV